MDQTQNLPSNQTPQLISISELFPRSFAVYKPFFWKLAGLYLISIIGSLPIILIIGLFAVLMALVPISTAMYIIYVILGLAGVAAVLMAIYVALIAQVAMYRVIKDNNPAQKAWDAFKAARPYVWDFFTANLLAGIIILLWCLLLIIPGIIVAIYYQFVPWIVLVEGLKWKAALKRSKELVKGHWWAVFGRLLLPLVILWFVIGILGSFVGKDTDSQNMFNFFSQIVSLVVTPFYLAYGYYLYKSLVDLKNNQAVK